MSITDTVLIEETVNNTVSDATLDAAKAYADGLVIGGGFSDRGDYNPSSNLFPSTGGSGSGGAINQTDVWMISGSGILGGVQVESGDVLRSRVPNPGQTASNWIITERNLGYVPENVALKDASGGYSGLTLLKINFKNVLNTFTSFFTNSNTAPRTYTFQDSDGTIAHLSDIADKVTANAPIVGATKTKVTYGTNGLVISGADATTDDIAEGARLYFTDARSRAAVIASAITSGDTTHSPDGNSVFNALSAKINTADIVDGLTSTSTVFPLSANQGKVLKDYIDSSVVGLLDDRGNYNASGNVFPSSGGSGASGAILKGDLWLISVAGTLGGVAVGIGDQLRALVDTPAQTSSNWAVGEGNVGYVPLNKASNLSDIQNAATARTNLGLDNPANYPTLNQSTTGNAATVTTIPTLTSEVSNTGNAVTLLNSAVIGKVLTGFVAAAGTISATDTILQAFNKLVGNKDASGGYAGLTLFKINLRNAANSVTSFLTNTNAVSRTYSLQDRDGVLADDTDLLGKQSSSAKDASGGYVGLTLLKINFKNVANTFISFFTNNNTASRTYTFPDVSGIPCVYVAIDTFVNINTNFLAANYSGYLAFANDLNVALLSDGTRWKAVTNKVVIANSSVAQGIAQSGMITTGSSNNWTLGSALPQVYSEGIWLYMASALSTPAISAGLKWCVFSSTTVCTIYTNGPGSAAYNFSLGGVTLGITGTEVTFSTTSIPANFLGLNGKILVSPRWSTRASGGQKTPRVRFASLLASTFTISGNGSTAGSYDVEISNRGVANKQLCNPSTLTYGFDNVAATTIAADTTSAQSVTVTGQIASMTDFLILESNTVQVSQ